MKLKRIASAILSVMMILSVFQCEVFAKKKTNAQICSQMLSELNALPYYLKNYSGERKVTRGDFLRTASLLFKISPMQEGNVNDVEDADLRGYVNAAVDMGAVELSADGNFSADDKIAPVDAVRIMVVYLGYGKVMNDNSEESLELAQTIDIMDGLTDFFAQKTVTYSDMLKILCNALFSKPLEPTVKTGEVIYRESDRTILKKLYYIDEEKVKIKSIVTSANDTVSVETESKDKGDKQYTVASTYKFPQCEGTTQYIWINEDGEIVFCYSDKPYEIIYDYVVAVNKSDNTNEKKASEIKNLEFAGRDGYYDVNNDFELWHNGERVTGKDYINGVYVRAVVENEKINSVEIYSKPGDSIPEEGGIIEKTEDGVIYYRKGDSSIDKLELGSDNVTVIIDGVKTSTSRLKKGMVFEYCCFSEKTVIIADDWKYEGKITEIRDDGIMIKDELVPMSYRQIYTSRDGGITFKQEQPDKFLNVEVSVLADPSGSARFIITQSDADVYGIVLGGNFDDEIEEKELKIACIGDTIKEKTYSVKLSASSEVDYDTARSNAKNADGNGIYEFKISNGVIKKISNIDWEKSDGELKTSTGRFPGAYAAIDIGAREKGFKEECIISLKDYNGDFNPQYVPWNALVNKQYTNLKYKIDEKMPTSDLFVIVDGMDSLRGDTTLFGIVINKETRYDPYTESIVNEYSFLTNGATKSMVFEEDKDPLKWNKNDIIEYYDGGGFKETGYMSIVSKDNLFPIDEPKGIGSVSYEKGGVYEGTSNKMVKVNNAGETQWYFLHSSYQVFEVVNKNKVKKSDLNSALGKKVYFLKSKSRVYCIFYLNE